MTMKPAEHGATTFTEMLKCLDITEDQYIIAIRWSTASDKFSCKKLLVKSELMYTAKFS